MEYRIELIEHFHHGALIDAIREDVPQNMMSGGYSRFVEMSKGSDDHFRVTTIFPGGDLYRNHYHVFHTPNCVMVFLKPSWEGGVSGRLWVKYTGMDNFMLLGEINNDYDPGLIIGPQMDDYYTRQWFETKPEGKMVELIANRDGIFAKIEEK